MRSSLYSYYFLSLFSGPQTDRLSGEAGADIWRRPEPSFTGPLGGSMPMSGRAVQIPVIINTHEWTRGRNP